MTIEQLAITADTLELLAKGLDAARVDPDSVLAEAILVLARAT
jgi:hypothetical protein